MTASTSLDLASDVLSVRAIGPWLSTLLGDLDDAEATALRTRLELAVHEVCVNIVDHADLPPGSGIRLDARVDPSAVVVVITDAGRTFDPAAVAAPQPGVPQIRGYGLMIVDQLVDSVLYERDHPRNRWTLRVDRRTVTDEGTSR